VTKISVPFLAAVGLSGPILCIPVAVIAGLIRPGYSMRADNLSGLGWGMHAWLMNADLIAFGLIMLCLAAGLWQTFERGKTSSLGGLLFTIWGLGLVAEGLFPTDPPGEMAQSLHSMIHDAAFVTLVTALACSSAVFARRFESEPRWQGYARYSYATAVAIPALLLLFLGLGDGSRWKGLVERLFLGVICLWVGLVAARLLHFVRRGAQTSNPNAASELNAESFQQA